MKYRSILVPVNGKDYADEMIELACKLALQDGAEVYALYVFEMPRTLPIEAVVPLELDRGKDVLARAEALGVAAGVKITSRFAQSRSAGVSILEEARQTGADLIMLGISGEPRIGGIDFGNTVSLVLKNASCRVIIGRGEYGGVA